MNYMFLPFEKHIDYGFGSMADSFLESGKNIMNKRKKNYNENIVACFLFRHSIELALKSMILIVHKGNKLPFGGGETRNKIILQINNKSINLFNTHDIGKLFEYYKQTINKIWAQIQGKCKTNWNEIPEELIGKFEKISKEDPQGFFFRYPNLFENDRKSYSRKQGLQQMLSKQAKQSVRAFVLIDKNDQVSSTYEFGVDNFKEVVKDYYYVANQLTGATIGLRWEMAHGW